MTTGARRGARRVTNVDAQYPRGAVAGIKIEEIRKVRRWFLFRGMDPLRQIQSTTSQVA
jgi:hypothetical protein